MSDAFISYSRKDIDFAQCLHHASESRNHDPWVDWRDILPTAMARRDLCQHSGSSYLPVYQPRFSGIRDLYSRDETRHLTQSAVSTSHLGRYEKIIAKARWISRLYYQH